MDRRFFLAGAGGALASLPLAGAAAAAGGQKGSVELIRSYVANRDQFPQAPLPRPNEVLHLERRPDRTFDRSSIAVRRSDGRQLGYLPPASTGLLATLLDEGFSAFAVVLPNTGTGDSDLQIQVNLKKDLSGVGWIASV